MESGGELKIVVGVEKRYHNWFISHIHIGSRGGHTGSRITD